MGNLNLRTGVQALATGLLTQTMLTSNLMKQGVMLQTLEGMRAKLDQVSQTQEGMRAKLDQVSQTQENMQQKQGVMLQTQEDMRAKLGEILQALAKLKVNE